MQRLIKRTTTVEEILVDEPTVPSEHTAGTEPNASDDRNVEHLSDDLVDAEDRDDDVGDCRRCPPCPPRR